MAQHFTDADFQQQVLQADKLTIVDFYADWCGPCKMMAPIVDELAHEYKDTVSIGKMDVDANPQFPGQYGISSIPTLLFFKGGQVVDSITGFAPKEKILEKIKANA